MLWLLIPSPSLAQDAASEEESSGMKDVTMTGILIAFAIGFVALLSIVCCLGCFMFFVKKFVFDDTDEEEDLKKRQSKILPMLNAGSGDQDYQVIVVNSDRH